MTATLSAALAAAGSPGLFSIRNTLFTLGGTGVSLIELLSVILGLATVFLAGRGKVLNFWFGYLYSISLFLLFLQKHLYFSMLLQPVSLTLNIIGHYRWTHPQKGEENQRNELKITRLKPAAMATAAAAVIALALLLAWTMGQLSLRWPGTFPPASNPDLDAFVTMMILTAQYLSAQKKFECWGAWLIVNTTNIILYLRAGLVFMPIVSACYLILAFFGIASWKKQMKEQ